MFNNSSNIDASHSTFSEVHRDQYYNAQSTVQGNQTINTVIHGNQILQDSNSNLIETLQKASAPSAAHDSAQRYPAPKCIEGTRIELLARLASWVEEQDQKPICWLNGRPGSGKSAVSQTIAEKYAGEKRLAASFFFSRRDVERRTTQHVVPTLTTQLLGFLPSIRPAVIRALENDYMIPMKVLREQMEKLLFEPISTATETPDSPIVLIVDALDECDDEGLVLELVALLALLPSKTSLPLRLLITSRAEPWLQSQFHRPGVSALTLPLDIHSFSVEEDIRTFLRRTLDDTYEQHLQVMKDLPRPWPSSDELENIVSKAGGLFIFALTVVKFIGDKMHNPIKRLQIILGNNASSVLVGSAYAELDSLYRGAISVFPDSDVARLVLGVVYCMAVPLSITGLDKLLQRPDVDASIVIPALSSVLLASEDGKQHIQFYHASFRDFLTDPQRSQKYTINPSVYHRLMAQLCLGTMLDSLKRDMCGIGDPAKANNEIEDLVERREAAFDEALLYSCRFWSRHLAQLPSDGVANEALLDALKRFSTTVLLCWIEALSIFGEVDSAVVMLRKCMTWLKTLREIPNDTLTLLKGAERLVVLYMDAISECALHVYFSAICFSDRDGAIHRTFKHQLYRTLITYPDSPDEWRWLRKSLALHNSIHSVVFSPNGDLIATAGARQGIQVWNTITGGNIASLGDCSLTSLLVCFSTSGAFLAAAFESGTVAVWDPKVGREHLRHERCHTEPITCIEFSKNDALLASGSRDHAIQVWSVETAQPLYRLATHEGPVTSLVFSNDSLRLISGAEDNLVIIWDMSTGRVVRGMMGHRKAVNCVAVSQDNRVAASGSEDKTIKIWDTNSGNCMQTFSKGHHTGIRSVHFFDDKHVVAACDESIISWNIASRNTSSVIWTVEMYYKRLLKHIPTWQTRVLGWGAPKSMLRYMHRQSMDDSTPRHLTVSFATRSPSFVFTNLGFPFSGSLPNPMNGLPLGDTGTINVIAVSPDGNWAAAADPLGALQIFDLSAPKVTWEDLEKEVKLSPLFTANQIVPSPNGTRFIVNCLLQWRLADADYNLIKKIDTGVMGSMRNNDDFQFKFSQNGKIFFCVISNLFDDDKSSLRIFDSVTGDQRAHLQGLKKVRSCVASNDGVWVACGHEFDQVEVFRVETNERTSIGESTGGSPVNVLSFSDDARNLVTGSESGVVRVWDRASGVCKATFEASTSKVTALAYARTPGGARVAIGREDGSLCLWSPSTSASHDIIRGDRATVKNVDLVQFSDDLSKLTSRGNDGTVCQWAVSFDADDTEMTRCAFCLCPGQESADGGSARDPDTMDLPHLLSRSDPDEAVDSLFHTAYRVRKDGWLVNGDRRVIWIAPSLRPCGKDALYAWENGQVVFYTPSKTLVFFKWE